MEDYKVAYFTPSITIGILLAIIVYTYSAEISRNEAHITALEDELVDCARSNKTLEETFLMEWE